MVRGPLSIRHACRILQVPRSSYYAALKPRPKKMIEPKLDKLMRQLHQDSRQSIGTRSMAKALSHAGYRMGRHRARSLMQAAGLERRRKRYSHYRRATKPAVLAPNVLNRQFNPARPNTSWVGDITYIRTSHGWLYLAVVLDLFSRRIVGWAFSPTADVELALKALRIALGFRAPAPGLVFHSDQGCQYTAERFVSLINEKGLVQSMSRRGNCWDNAVVERYFRTLKHDWMPQGAYASRKDAKKDVMDFIAYYNLERGHATLDYLSPADYEKLAA